MPKVIKPFGQTAVSAAVKRFLEAHGISPNDVMSYSIATRGGELEIITIEMFFEDIPEKEGN